MIGLEKEIEFFEYDKECAYLKDKLCDTRYKYMEFCTQEEYVGMLEHGWRRFGKVHFSPICKECEECISIRIDVKNFKFSKSHKRVFAKNKGTKLYIQKPTLSKDHLRLYEKYHKKMAEKKGWNYYDITALQYSRSYVEGDLDFAKEFIYMVDDKLVAVAIVDVLPQAISSIYCFYDHDYERLSIGKFSILTQIKLAKAMGIPYVYLGYWIKDHLSMGYKKEYMPYEYLRNRADLNEDALWEKYIN